MSDIEERLSELVGDLPRGRYADFIGKPPNAHFESPLNIAVSYTHLTLPTILLV